MKIHFISIEISVIGFTVGIVHSDGLFFGEDSCDVRHDVRFMKCGLTIEKQHISGLKVTVDDFFVHVVEESISYCYSLLFGSGFQIDSDAVFLDRVSTRMY